MQSIYFTFLSIFLLIYIGCSEKEIKQIDINSDKYKIDLLLSKIIDNCQAKTIKDNENSIFVENKNQYLSIDLNEKRDFNPHSIRLNENSKEKLSCIIPIIKENKGVSIIITGHANESNNNKKNQHLSDDRAISVAEQFFNEGVRDEIFAKGCSNKKEKKNGQVEIFIYLDKANIKNHCR